MPKTGKRSCGSLEDRAVFSRNCKFFLHQIFTGTYDVPGVVLSLEGQQKARHHKNPDPHDDYCVGGNREARQGAEGPEASEERGPGRKGLEAPPGKYGLS